MALKGSNTMNPNFKVCVRVRPIEFQSRMIETINETSLSIKDATNKTNIEKQMFNFNMVWDQFAGQDAIFQYTYEHAVQKVIEGNNACVLSYGQTGGGKTYSIFGEDERYTVDNIKTYGESRKDRRGLVPRAIELLLQKNKEFQGSKEFVLTCNFAEIYLDQVRDLGKFIHEQLSDRGSKSTRGKTSNALSMSSYENENLEIYEHTNGQIMVRNITNVVIRSMDDLYALLNAGFTLRDKYESKGNIQISARAHTIFTINVVQKDKENEDLPLSNSTLQFVDLAGSERIAKSLTEGQKFNEAILINSSLTAVGRVLLALALTSKSIPYRESKLTKALQNTLTPYSHIVLIGSLHPNETNFEECINTLQFLDRCRNVDFRDKRGPTNIGGGGDDQAMLQFSAFGGANDKMLKRLHDELDEAKRRIEFLQKDHKSKLEKLKKVLELDIDWDKFDEKSKEAALLSQQRDALKENENLKITIYDLERKVDEAERDNKTQTVEFHRVQEKNVTEITELREQLRRAKEQRDAKELDRIQNLKAQNSQLENEIKSIRNHNKTILEEKTEAIMNFHSNLSVKMQELSKIGDQKARDKRELEMKYNDDLKHLKDEYQKLFEALKQQYELFLKTKNDDFDHFANDAKFLLNKKKTQIKSMRQELVDLYDICSKQAKVIEKIENGTYSGGIRSFNIPAKDKPIAPTRIKYPNLYKYLDRVKLNATAKKFEREDKPKEDKPEEANLTRKSGADLKKSLQPMASNSSQPEEANKSKNLSLVSNKSRQDIANKAFKDQQEEQNYDLSLNVHKIKDDELRIYADNIRIAYKKLKDKNKELEGMANKYMELNIFGDINEIIRERDTFKQKYKEQVKIANDIKVAMESQKRLLQNTTKFSQSGFIRPSTSGKF